MKKGLAKGPVKYIRGTDIWSDRVQEKKLQSPREVGLKEALLCRHMQTRDKGVTWEFGLAYPLSPQKKK